MLPSMQYDFNTPAVLVAMGFAAYIKLSQDKLSLDIKSLKDTNAQHEDSIKSLKKEHGDAIKSLKEEDECSIKSLKEEHGDANKEDGDAIKSLNVQHEDGIKSLEESLSKGAIKREGALKEYIEEKLKDTNAQHEDAIKSLKEELGDAIKSLKEEDECSIKSLKEEHEKNPKDAYKSLDQLRLDHQCYQQRCESDIADLNQKNEQQDAKTSKEWDEVKELHRDLELNMNEDAMSRQKDKEIQENQLVTLEEGVDNVLNLCEENWKSVKVMYQELKEMNGRTTDGEAMDTVASFLTNQIVDENATLRNVSEPEQHLKFTPLWDNADSPTWT
jgi:hypothetical protein